MKIVKGGILIISTLLLFLSILTANILFSISWSISYDEVKSDLSNTVLEILEKEYDLTNYIKNNKEGMLDHCSPHENYFFDFNPVQKNISCQKILSGMQYVTDDIILDLDENSRVLITQKVVEDYDYMKEYCAEKENYYSGKIKKNISCENIKSGKQAIIDGLVEEFVIEIYYNNYSRCNFWDCARETGATHFLVSQKAKNYWNSWLNKLLLFSLVLLILIFFLVDNKYNSLFIAGASVFLSGFPLLKVESFILIITKPFFKTLEFINYQDTSTIKSIISVFFTKSTNVFYICFTLGIILLVAWAIVRFWSFFTGRDKKLFSKKDVQKMIQKELKTKENKKVND